VGPSSRASSRLLRSNGTSDASVARVLGARAGARDSKKKQKACDRARGTSSESDAPSPLRAAARARVSRFGCFSSITPSALRFFPAGTSSTTSLKRSSRARPTTTFAEFFAFVDFAVVVSVAFFAVLRDDRVTRFSTGATVDGPPMLLRLGRAPLLVVVSPPMPFPFVMSSSLASAFFLLAVVAPALRLLVLAPIAPESTPSPTSRLSSSHAPASEALNRLCATRIRRLEGGTRAVDASRVRPLARSRSDSNSELKPENTGKSGRAFLKRLRRRWRGEGASYFSFRAYRSWILSYGGLVREDFIIVLYQYFGPAIS
jgi:hypothetical protein